MWTTKHTVILGAASAVSLAVGSASGWFLAKKQLGAEFDKRLEVEIETTRNLYANLHKDDPEVLAQKLLDEAEAQPKHPYDTTSDEVPAEVLERVADSMARAQQEVEEEAKPMADPAEAARNAFENPEAARNAFENPEPEWVQEDEELGRRNGVPYIISHDEFYENKWEFTEGHLTYYEGDDTLADSRDEPIVDQYAAVGELTLERFGFGSKDPNIVYACNEQMEMIFEIARSTKSFAEDVLGFVGDGSTRELKHSDRPRRFRPERDD